MTTTQEAYDSLVEAVRSLGSSLSPAVQIRFEAPPRSQSDAGSSFGISNPTLSIVLDPLRSALSDEVHCAEMDMAVAAKTLSNRADRLSRAVSAWEGGGSK